MQAEAGARANTPARHEAIFKCSQEYLAVVAALFRALDCRERCGDALVHRTYVRLAGMQISFTKHVARD